MFNRSEAFRRMIGGVMAQGRPAIEDGVCRYRLHKQTSDTIRCAIGQIIPDDKYDPEFESTTPESYNELAAAIDPDMSREDATFLTLVQKLHDNVALKINGKAKFEGVAIDWDNSDTQEQFKSLFAVAAYGFVRGYNCGKPFEHMLTTPTCLFNYVGE